MFGALRKVLFGYNKASVTAARSRLHFVLVQDRTGLSNEEMALFKEEMVKVIERYFLIDKEGFDITYRRDHETTTLQINSPVVLRRAAEKSAGNNKVKELPVKPKREGARERLKERVEVKEIKEAAPETAENPVPEEPKVETPEALPDTASSS